ncbi:MAG: 3-deoxy-D-manno-octulosonic acid transferase [Proteobacteria bacterium]|nr:3-deoxy-D-manno-octulosonic acid transferase [Pseudomonadota bacterium]MBU0989818.1 3-deoxy-D-manno-octulosonic acid transferase [Pseudomonadota bacterium]MBU1905335.1 3-deoxy-D-manno-octulosonic acid transferase [Pseudomonadota bacterium]
MFMFVYHFLWTLGLAFCLPVIGLSRNRSPVGRTGRRFAERVRERVAWKFPEVFLGKGNIWVHALSVGEVVSALPLVNSLKKEFPGKDVVFTVTTATGMAIAKEKLGGRVKAILTMPVDAWWSVQRIVNFVKPAVFILVETDIWPALLCRLKSKGIPSILVNGRVSPRTFRSYARIPSLTRKMFDPVKLCLMQSDLDRERLLKTGLNKEKVITVGNIKFDHDMALMSDKERQDWFDILGFDSSAPLWVAGSTHPGEEKILLGAFERLRASFPLLRLIIAPRDAGRSDEIVTMIRRMGLAAVLKTEVSEQSAKRKAQSAKRRVQLATRNPQPATRHMPSRDGVPYDVLVLNTMGELGHIYGIASLSFVGGSLVPVGGHNLLEPATFGCPVLFGPHTHNFVSMSEALLECRGGCRVRDGNELYDTMLRLLGDKEMCARMGDRAKGFVEKNRGALERVVEHVKGSMEQGA